MSNKKSKENEKIKEKSNEKKNENEKTNENKVIEQENYQVITFARCWLNKNDKKNKAWCEVQDNKIVEAKNGNVRVRYQPDPENKKPKNEYLFHKSCLSLIFDSNITSEKQNETFIEKKSEKQNEKNNEKEEKQVVQTWTLKIKLKEKKIKGSKTDEIQKLLDGFTDSVICFSDGAAKGNPGPAGAGAFVIFPSSKQTKSNLDFNFEQNEKQNEKENEKQNEKQNEKKNEKSEICKKRKLNDADNIQKRKKEKINKTESRYLALGLNKTNNVAELFSIWLVLDIIDQHEKKFESEVKDKSIEIFSDSKYVIGMLQQNWKASKNEQLISALKHRLEKRRLKSQQRIFFHWVPGHSNVPGNERADQLANQGALDSLNFDSKLISNSDSKLKTIKITDIDEIIQNYIEIKPDSLVSL